MATTHPAVGVDHVTVVPENYEPEAGALTPPAEEGSADAEESGQA